MTATAFRSLRSPSAAAAIRPVAPPRLIDAAYSEDQYQRLIGVVREHGPWQLILAENFERPEEVIAATAGEIPEGVQITWEMVLTPVFRGYLARQGVCFHPELEDCYYNSRFLQLVRGYRGAKYAEPETFLFNIQGPSPIGGPPHLDGTVFRGLTMENAPIWLLMTMARSGLFRRWQAKKGQVIAWYYRGSKGGGFNCWPNGPEAAPLQIQAPMWGRAVVVENERMFHHGQACGPVALRKPAGLDIRSVFGADPESRDGWRITTGSVVNQRVPASETRLLVHWGARLSLDFAEMKTALDHRDDLTHEQAIGMLIDDLHARGIGCETPSDPLNDRGFIRLVSQAYDIGVPQNVPPDAVD